MRAVVLERVGGSLAVRELQKPRPGPGDILIRVTACGVCRTDLHILDGELEGELGSPALPLVPGHQVVGRVEAFGDGARNGADSFKIGDAVGLPWLGETCGACGYCRSGRENLCDDARFTGYHKSGGYAEYVVADARYCVALPEGLDGSAAAPLLCAGLIGYRALRLAGEGRRLGLYGFGASAHIVLQLARAQGRQVYAFTRPGDLAGQAFARELGAHWAGGSEERLPEPLDAAIIFAPVGALVPRALEAVAKGGVVVCAGIHMSDIPAFPYASLWGERCVRSVANLTRSDAREFFALARTVPIRTEVEVFPLEQAGAALEALRAGRIRGAAVLAIGTVVDESP